MFLIKLSKKTFLFFLFAVTLWISCDLLTVYGLKISSSVNYSILSRLQIFISFFGACLFLKEKINLYKIVSVIVSLIGGIIVVYNFRSAIKINPGDLLFLMAVLSISISGLFRQKITETVSALQLTYLMFGFGALTLGLVTFLFSPINVVPPTGFILFNAIIGLIGFNLVNYSISKGGAAFFSIVSNILPVFTIVFSFIIFKNLPELTQIIGGLLIVFSIFLFQKNKLIR